MSLVRWSWYMVLLCVFFHLCVFRFFFSNSCFAETTSSFRSFRPAEAIATIQVQISEPKKSTREFRDCFATPEVAFCRFWKFHVGAISGVSVPANRSRGRSCFSGFFFHQRKWSMIHDVNTSLHWRLGEFQSKMKKWFLVQSRSWRFYHPRCHDANIDSANHAACQSCRIQVPAQFGGLVLGCELWTVDFVKDGDGRWGRWRTFF